MQFFIKTIYKITGILRTNYLVSWSKNELFSIMSKLFFFGNLVAIELKKTQIFKNKAFYLGLSISKLIKIVMHEFWNECVKPKYAKKVTLWIQTALSST